MPSTWTGGVVTSSTAVAVTYSTASQQLFGVPFIVKHQSGAIVHSVDTVADTVRTHVVAVTGFTSPKPGA